MLLLLVLLTTSPTSASTTTTTVWSWMWRIEASCTFLSLKRLERSRPLVKLLDLAMFSLRMGLAHMMAFAQTSLSTSRSWRQLCHASRNPAEAAWLSSRTTSSFTSALMLGPRLLKLKIMCPVLTTNSISTAANAASNASDVFVSKVSWVIMHYMHHFRLVMMFGTFCRSFTSVAVWPLGRRVRLSWWGLSMVVMVLVPSVTFVSPVTALVTLAWRGSTATVIVVSRGCWAAWCHHCLAGCIATASEIDEVVASLPAITTTTSPTAASTASSTLAIGSCLGWGHGHQRLLRLWQSCATSSTAAAVSATIHHGSVAITSAHGGRFRGLRRSHRMHREKLSAAVLGLSQCHLPYLHIL